MAADISVESSILIARPVDDVWAFVSDPRNEPKWHTDIVSIRSPSNAAPPQSWTKGAVWLVTVDFLGRRDYEVEVTEVDEPRRIEFTTRSGPFRPIANYLLEPTAQGTRFTRSVEVRPTGASRLFRPMLRRSIARRNEQFVANLNRMLERPG